MITNNSKIQKLIWLADINLLVCNEIYISQRNKEEINKFLLLSANNAFNEAVNILHTLLVSTKKEELRIRPILEQIIKEEQIDEDLQLQTSTLKEFEKRITSEYPTPDYLSYRFLYDKKERLGSILSDLKKLKRKAGLQDLEDIKKEFEEGNFHKIRHQSVAHKNKLLSNPSGTSSHFLKEIYLKNLEEIMKRLRILAYFWFGYDLPNPNFKTLLDLRKST